jgi:hypothetical protein
LVGCILMKLTGVATVPWVWVGTIDPTRKTTSKKKWKTNSKKN